MPTGKQQVGNHRESGLDLRGMKRNQKDKAENGKYLNRGDEKCKEDKWQHALRKKGLRLGKKSVRKSRIYIQPVKIIVL